MRAFVAALCAALVFATTATAQEGKYATTPISGCPEVAKPWLSNYTVKVHFLLRTDCTFEIRAMFQKFTGIATLRNDGTLIIPFVIFGGVANSRFELRRSSNNLNGYAMDDEKSYFISFQPAP